MDNRKEFILNTIIKEHIKTGVPVGSSILVDKYKLDISPATVRNEMAELEDENYIVQPYTSAGRIPTEKAYSLFTKNIKEKKLRESEIKMLNMALKEKNELHFKQTAKLLAKLSNNAVFWAFHKNNFYYTGISNLLQQPEFYNSELIYNISVVIDRMDEIIDDIFYDINEGVDILLGSANPFGNFCSTIFCKYKNNENVGLFGILGPMRMNYERNLALAKFVNEKISK